MFDKKRFAQVLKNINDTYNNQREFSVKSNINRTYLSQYMNMKLDEPPKPKILEKIAISSHGIIDYNDLMEICGYINDNYFSSINSLEEKMEESENYYINKIINCKLSSSEEQVYNDLSKIINPNKFKHYSNFQKQTELESYFENMDYINEKSKHKIIEKLKLFIDYCNSYLDLMESMHKLKHDQLYSNKKTKADSDISLIEDILNNKFYKCPVYGKIAAGEPNWAEECLDGYLPIDPALMNISNPEECFFLRVDGESMNKIIDNGAYALIRKTDFVENDEIAVVLVNGCDATLKKFSKEGNIIVLSPESTDNSFKQQIYTKETPIKIIGKYLGKMELKYR